MVLKRFGGTLVANNVNKILWNKFIGTRWRFVYSCRQRTVKIERCVKSAALPDFGSRISAAAARTDTLVPHTHQQQLYIVQSSTWSTYTDDHHITSSSSSFVYFALSDATEHKYSMWNSLSLSVCDPSLTMTQFCTHLKTFLFRRAYCT